MINSNYLKYLIAEKGLSIEDVAVIMKISKQALYKKIRGETEWCLRDMKCLKDFLEMTDEDVKKVFDL